MHKSQIADLNAYRGSPLIGVQILGILLLFLTTPLTLIIAITLAVTKKFKPALITIGLLLITLVAIFASMVINKETLIGMT